MAKERKNMSMLRPNIMWFWTAITLVIVGYWIFSDGEAQPVTTDKATVEQLVRNGDVKEIVVVNDKEARVVLKGEKIDSLRGSDKRYLNVPERGYQLQFRLGSLEKFENDFEKANKEGDAERRCQFFLCEIAFLYYFA